MLRALILNEAYTEEAGCTADVLARPGTGRRFVILTPYPDDMADATIHLNLEELQAMIELLQE